MRGKAAHPATVKKSGRKASKVGQANKRTARERDARKLREVARKGIRAEQAAAREQADAAEAWAEYLLENGS